MYYEIIYRSMQEEMPKEIETFIKKRTIIPSSGCYLKFYKDVCLEVKSKRGIDFKNIDPPKEVYDDILYGVVERYRNQTLKSIIESIGEDGLKQILRRDGSVL